MPVRQRRGGGRRLHQQLPALPPLIPLQREPPKVIWIWGGDTVEENDQALQDEHLAMGEHTLACGWESPLASSNRVTSCLETEGGIFPAKVFVIDDSRTDQFRNMTDVDRTKLRDMLRQLFNRHYLVRGPGRRVRRLVPNDLTHVLVSCNVSPRSVLHALQIPVSQYMTFVDLKVQSSR